MKITNVHVKRLTGLPRLLGTASVVFDDCFKVRDIFVLPKNKDELYIAMPSKKVRDNHWIYGYRTYQNYVTAGVYGIA